jgi:hypothetical protein
VKADADADADADDHVTRNRQIINFLLERMAPEKRSNEKKFLKELKQYCTVYLSTNRGPLLHVTSTWDDLETDNWGYDNVHGCQFFVLVAPYAQRVQWGWESNDNLKTVVELKSVQVLPDEKLLASLQIGCAMLDSSLTQTSEENVVSSEVVRQQQDEENVDQPFRHGELFIEPNDASAAVDSAAASDAAAQSSRSLRTPTASLLTSFASTTTCLPILWRAMGCLVASYDSVIIESEAGDETQQPRLPALWSTPLSKCIEPMLRCTLYADQCTSDMLSKDVRKTLETCSKYEEMTGMIMNTIVHTMVHHADTILRPWTQLAVADMMETLSHHVVLSNSLESDSFQVNDMWKIFRFVQYSITVAEDTKDPLQSSSSSSSLFDFASKVLRASISICLDQKNEQHQMTVLQIC